MLPVMLLALTAPICAAAIRPTKDDALTLDMSDDVILPVTTSLAETAFHVLPTVA